MASATLGRGGTSLPGLVALRLDPRLVQHLAGALDDGALVVAGTNGKTTTSGMLASALGAGGRHVVHNRAGSNMLRGLATTLAEQATLGGRLRDSGGLMGLFEVDEAALPTVLAQVRPRVVVLTNLFRDQLDRYGELQTTADRWRAALKALPTSTTLVLNADDPLVASLGVDAPGAVLYFGVASWPEEVTAEPSASADSLYCPSCDGRLAFGWISYAHLGDWSCPVCGAARPALAIAATVAAADASGSRLSVRVAGERVGVAPPPSAGEASTELSLGLPGRYNVYNALAALSGALAVGLDLPVAARAVAGTRGAFGRAETIAVEGRLLRLFLIKNPTGADEVLRVIESGDRSATLLALLSDQAADGHDVSWIWDAQFELLRDWSGPVYCGGTRAEDMALRLKYATPLPAGTIISDDIQRALDEAIRGTSRGGALVIVATYTAMLAVRNALSRAGHVDPYWKATA